MAGPGRVVLAMSGGVDSSAAALLLKRAGYEVIGLFMRTGEHGDAPARRHKTCCSATDALDARRVADALDIPFYALDFAADFERIIDDFADEYLAGRTPNPCVMCNIWLKFGKLWAYGKQAGADFVATGHYARIVADADGRPRLARGLDPTKDQSYVLSGLRRELLPKLLFPVGDQPKAEIRRIARAANLPVHDKPDSQEICFIPDDDYVGFLRQSRPDALRPGPVLDESDREVGRHEGIAGYTIGQRKGLKIAFGTPRYVTQIEPSTNVVRIGPRTDLLRDGLIAGRFNWQEDPPDGHPLPCTAQIRSQHKAVPATVEPLPAEGQALVRFESPQPAISPGQVVALYRGEVVIGGGWIDRAWNRENLDGRSVDVAPVSS